MAEVTESMAGTVRGRPEARTSLSLVLSHLSDYAAQLVPTIGDSYVLPREWAAVIRRIHLFTIELGLRGVIMIMEDCRSRGMSSDESWAVAADGMWGSSDPGIIDEFREEFEDAYDRWRRGEKRTYHPDHVAAHVGTDFDPPSGVAANDLDGWVLARTPAGEIMPYDAPVSANLY